MEQQQQVPKPDYTDEELEYRNWLIGKLETSRELRGSGYVEFDDETYETIYEENAKAAHSYLRPKMNIEDTRIVTGTTQEKGNALISSVLNYNLEPVVQVFDGNNELITEIGKEVEDLVKKSRELENYDEKRILIYKELFDQGTVFVDETYTIETRSKKTVTGISWSEGVEIDKITIREELEKAWENPSSDVVSGLKVYLGNIREFFITNQPYLFTVETIPYETARMIYGTWERWKNVPRKIVHTTNLDNVRDWTLLDTKEDMCEIIRYQNKPGNEIMIMINGIMMIPIRFPLTEISPSGEYTLSKGDQEPISRWFAYSKSVPAKIKMHQEVMDEFLRLIILKTQQSFMPPAANNTNRDLSRNIYLPGKITPGIDGDRIKPLITHTGVTQSEFEVMDMIKRLVDEQTTSQTFSGQQMKGDTTATEVRELQKMQMMKMGLVIYGIVNLERQIVWKRIHNIIKNWTKPIGRKVVGEGDSRKVVDVYKRFILDSIDETGQKVKKIIQFDPGKTELSADQIKSEEDMLEEKYGMPVRKSYVDPKSLRDMKLTFSVIITPTDKQTDELKSVMFTKKIADANTLFPGQVNQEYVKRRWAILAGEDPNKFFVRGGVNPAMMGDQGQPDGAATNAGVGQDFGTGMNQAVQQTMVKEQIRKAQ